MIKNQDESKKRIILFFQIIYDSNYSNVANDLGITRQAVTSLLKNHLTHNTLKKLERLGLNPDWVETGNGSMFSSNLKGRELEVETKNTMTYIFNLRPATPEEAKEFYNKGIETDIQDLKDTVFNHEQRIKKLEQK